MVDSEARTQDMNIEASVGKGAPATPKANIVLLRNPKTGLMQEYHFTKGWR